MGAVLFPVPTALAAEVTNPAEHPVPVKVTIDGQVYNDGLDTLPGYDDYACTPIPNVQYDFASNQVLYYDDRGELAETAKWTEWSRISSYQTWVKQQQSKPASTPTPAPAASTPAPSTTGSAPSSSAAPGASAPSTTSAPAAAAPRPAQSAQSAPGASPSKSSGTRGTSGKSSSSKGESDESATVKRAAGAAVAGPSVPGVVVPGAADGKASSTDPAATTPEATTPAADGAVGTSPVAPGGAVAPEASAGPAQLSEAVREGAGAGAGDTRVAGVGLLAALALAGIGLPFGKFARRQALGLSGPADD
jgi:hypothetical protein